MLTVISDPVSCTFVLRMLALLLIMITLARLNAGCARQAVSAEGLLERQSSVIGLTGVFSRSGEHLRGALTMSYHDHGRMDQRCATTGCGAYYWKSEVQDQGKHLNCCWKRKEKKWTQSLPSAASRLYDDSAQCPAYAPREFSEFQASGVRGKDLYKNSRQYSNSFALASAQNTTTRATSQVAQLAFKGKSTATSRTLLHLRMASNLRLRRCTLSATISTASAAEICPPKPRRQHNQWSSCTRT